MNSHKTIAISSPPSPNEHTFATYYPPLTVKRNTPPPTVESPAPNSLEVEVLRVKFRSIEDPPLHKNTVVEVPPLRIETTHPPGSPYPHFYGVESPILSLGTQGHTPGSSRSPYSSRAFSRHSSVSGIESGSGTNRSSVPTLETNRSISSNPYNQDLDKTKDRRPDSAFEFDTPTMKINFKDGPVITNVFYLRDLVKQCSTHRFDTTHKKTVQNVSDEVAKRLFSVEIKNLEAGIQGFPLEENARTKKQNEMIEKKLERKAASYTQLCADLFGPMIINPNTDQIDENELYILSLLAAYIFLNDDYTDLSKKLSKDSDFIRTFMTEHANVLKETLATSEETADEEVEIAKESTQPINFGLKTLLRHAMLCIKKQNSDIFHLILAFDRLTEGKIKEADAIKEKRQVDALEYLYVRNKASAAEVLLEAFFCITQPIPKEMRINQEFMVLYQLFNMLAYILNDIESIPDEQLNTYFNLICSFLKIPPPKHNEILEKEDAIHYAEYLHNQFMDEFLGIIRKLLESDLSDTERFVYQAILRFPYGYFIWSTDSNNPRYKITTTNVPYNEIAEQAVERLLRKLETSKRYEDVSEIIDGLIEQAVKETKTIAPSPTSTASTPPTPQAPRNAGRRRVRLNQSNSLDNLTSLGD